ncbi:DUF3085 domain-containing protein [Paraburkholderia sp. MM5477-R1]|uniref:DUF3085 domain-containing protein n=1 Tax=Paraburkholderia sp. MM5477-R1 TaxID=2991062 RepID=UPI003D1961B5
MKLHFPVDQVRKAIEELDSAQTARTLYETETGKGLWLVGDQGVYLMPNTTDGTLAKARQEGEPAFIVYARECDPKKLDFDTWWANKRASFGGDDGVDFIALAELRSLLVAKPNAKSAKDLVADFRCVKYSIFVE